MPGQVHERLVAALNLMPIKVMDQPVPLPTDLPSSPDNSGEQGYYANMEGLTGDDVNNSNLDDNGKEGWKETADIANYWAGLAFMGMEGLPGSFRLGTAARGFSPKFYANAWRGNQYATTFNVGKLGGALGKISFGIGFLADAQGVINYYDDPNSPNAVHPGKAGLNTGMGAYGIWVNPAAGVLFSTMDVFYPGGWQGYINDVGSVQQELNTMTNYQFRLIPFGPK